MKKYSKNFWAICTSLLLFMTSFNLIIPELNDFITILGGIEYKGLIITLFTLSAAISRPFSGKLSDTIGRKSTMYIGITVSTIVTFLYPLCGSVLFFLTLRFFHGFSTGFLPTGATALVTDILPADKRGQGMGVFGTATSLGIGVGQFLGSPITNLVGLDGLFIISGMLAIIAGLMILTVRETLKNPQTFSPGLLKIKKTEIIERNVIPAGIVMILTATCSGIIFVLSPDMSEYLGIANKGWFFFFYVISTIGIRLFTGKVSDKYGRRETLIAGCLVLCISMLIVGFSESMFMFTIGAIVFGIATGINSPTLFAWMADLSPSHRRGISAGTLFIALEVGIMFGATSTLYTYESTFKSVPQTFMVGAGFSIVALLYILWHLKFRRQQTTY
ncbi:Predicted arabinose efflux permease, MFS family [Lishizhenia tianjinensis]|uniref:Predicted arabinose efflux permease, MFS family n=1 Tax=Lishizhenia tianjinensis TaxID=477690 RepID=A0A1I7AM46_9FLAO|nr:MFS transporter [Lishizhenia tianjinensis]SFT76020.1 Predicted arabinose efflux permease, MFS family [Lishizhenia tianjinensis]